MEKIMQNYMKAVKYWLSPSFIAILFTPLFATQAATVEVIWTDPDSYQDIYPAQENKKRFRARTFASLDKHFVKLAAKLPEGQTLKVNVTDVDLAGDTHLGGINRLRIIKEIYFPRITFSYHLLSADGSELSSAEVNLKDMNFMLSSGLRYRNKSLGHEKHMLDQWFKKTFLSPK